MWGWGGGEGGEGIRLAGSVQRAPQEIDPGGDFRIFSARLFRCFYGSSPDMPDQSRMSEGPDKDQLVFHRKTLGMHALAVYENQGQGPRGGGGPGAGGHGCMGPFPLDPPMAALS